MGKRELLIIAGFVAAGVVAFYLTAPPRLSPQRPFTLSGFVRSFGDGGRRGRVGAVVTKDQVIALSDALNELRVSNVAHLVVVGEGRNDLAYSLTVETTGDDRAAASARARTTTIRQDVVGPVLSLRAVGEHDDHPSSRLTIRVPSRFAVRVQGGASVDAIHVRSLELDGVVGDVRARDVSGLIAGNHRNGELSIADAGSVNLRTVASTIDLQRVQHDVTLTARDGQARVRDVGGASEIDGTNQETFLISSRGPVRIAGLGGRVSVENPSSAVVIDVRHTAVSVRLMHPVGLTVFTSDEPLSLRLDAPDAYVIDAVATDGGRVHADDFSWTPMTDGDEVRVRHGTRADGVPVSLRNQRGEIVIARTK